MGIDWFGMGAEMNTKYTGVFNREPIYRGDTLDGFRVTATVDDTGDLVVPAAVCMQLRNETGRLVHSFDVDIEPAGSILVRAVDGSVTAEWKAGVYRYDIEYTLPAGRVRTYISGSVTILGDVSQCHAG